MNNFITLITTLDPRFTIGWALLWYGAGLITAALAWAWEKHQQKKFADKLVEVALSDILKSRGHVIDYHGHGPRASKLVHAHCVCGEMSLDFAAADSTTERLMEQWADEHIDSLMESSGR